MILSPGRRLGPYEIVAPLGAGGMGGRPWPERSRTVFHLEGVVAVDFDYDVARDGQRFLVRLSEEPEGAAGLRVAREWSRLLAGPDAGAR